MEYPPQSLNQAYHYAYHIETKLAGLNKLQSSKEEFWKRLNPSKKTDARANAQRLSR
jgi:hypothetical protein